MSARITLATAARVLRQLRRDRRTLVLVLFVPAVLMTLFRYVFDGQEATFDRVGPPMVGIFPFVTMFLVTSIAMLRERTTGTLERLMSMPLGKLDLLLGYGLAFHGGRRCAGELHCRRRLRLPRLLLAGLLVPRDKMAPAIELVSDVLPMTYAYDALARAAADDLGERLALDAVVIAGFIVLSLVLGATTLRRRTP